MKILIHKNARVPVKVISYGKEEILLTSSTCTGALWELAEKFPDQLIAWCEEDLEEHLALENWRLVFHHNLIMASYAVKTIFLPETIGYIDQMPFININRNVSYGTWQMSSDLGGVKGKVLLNFRSLYNNENGLNYFLNSVAKIGQQNGLFCYSEPGLINLFKDSSPKKIASKKELFRFVFEHYSNAWTSVLLLCFIVFERSFPIISYIQSFFNTKHFRKPIDLSHDMDFSKREKDSPETIDVIIPTMGRAFFLYDVLKDFSTQTHLPEKVIIVEQNPDPASKSALDYLQIEKWPFQIIHHFIHRAGACNARNIALEEVASGWVFFADDDIRLEKDLLQNFLSETGKYDFCALNLNCRQPGEDTIFEDTKQWGSFGSGTSLVKSHYAKKCKYSTIFEHGHGEDADFGMQLRNAGSDIIYHPHLEIRHLKAPSGGFRQKQEFEWEREQPLPKPSPTVMAYAMRNFTPHQLKGYKISLFLKFYPLQNIKNPVSYISSLNKRWKKSMFWAEKLIKNETKPLL